MVKELEDCDPNIKLEIDDFDEKFPKIWKSIMQQLETHFGEDIQEAYDLIDNKDFLEKIKTTLVEGIPLIIKIGYLNVSLFWLS